MRRATRLPLVDGDAHAAVADAVASLAGKTGADAINSALFFPWLSIPDPLQQNALRDLPPCGCVAGVFGGTDLAHGVWKSPSGIGATLHGGAVPRLAVNDAQSAALARTPSTACAASRARAPSSSGARARSPATTAGLAVEVRPVRRLALFLEESLVRGTRFAVFEPNGEPLWAKIRLAVGNFLQVFSCRARCRATRRPRPTSCAATARP